jgi:large subunit ribosomal protein L17
MRHRKAGRKLNRNASHRLALYRNLAKALFQHERIITTVAKAKAVKPFVEKLITLAKKAFSISQAGDLAEKEKLALMLHARRLVLSRLGPAAEAEVRPAGEDKENPDTRTVLAKLFADIGPRYSDRPGGYTRIIKRHERRLGDAGPTAYLELLKEGEKKVKIKAAPAPKVEEDQPAEQEQETPAPESQSPEQTPATEGATTETKPEGEAGQTPPK